MKRFGIDNSKALGVAIPYVRKLAGIIKKNQPLSLDLWDTGIHEARILATIIGDPTMVTSEQMDKWVQQVNSWDVCDQACGNLFDRTTIAIDKAHEYSRAPGEFVKRAGFVLMAACAVHNKIAPNKVFINFMPVIEHEAWDERNFVKKAVNWALRQIGKRNKFLLDIAIETAYRIDKQPHKSSRWIAKNALTELLKQH